jgi:hypothetical protein
MCCLEYAYEYGKEEKVAQSVLEICLYAKIFFLNENLVCLVNGIL